MAALAACGAPARSAPPATETPAPAPSPAAPPARGAGVIVTFRVAGAETYKILLTDPADIEIARKLLAGEEAPRIPNGVVVRGDPGVNEGYSWHIDPASVEFADMAMEVCDGRPSDVEQQIITSDRYCPWSAEVIAVDDIADTAADPLLVSLHQSGGIAGVDETLTVYADGRVELTDRSGQVRAGQLAAGDLEALRSLLESPELARAEDRYQAPGADQFVYEITLLSGAQPRTITTMDGADHPAVVGQLLAELARLRPGGA